MGPGSGRMTWRVVDDAIGISLSRMGVECLDLLQFHWWDYNDKSYVDALKHLADLQHEGKIRHLALTNFDTERLGVIADCFHIVSNQVQYSLIDRRAESQMTSFCREHSMTLLAYGTLLGGLLSEKYLGRPEPRRHELTTASLHKYKNMIDAWGGWSLFQELLAVLKQIADKHRVTYRQYRDPLHFGPSGGGWRHRGRALGVTQHITENTRVFGFTLDPSDLALIEPVLAKSRDLMQIIGDCGDEYR